MHVLVVGAGATGGFYGARLAQAGTEVTFLVRPRRAGVLRERGLRLTGQGEDEVIMPRLVTAGAFSGSYDLVLLSVKAGALDEALTDIAPAVGPGTAVVPLLNGMRHLDELNARFGAARVLGGVAKVQTTLNGAGDIVRLAPGGVLTVGEQDGRSSARVDAVRTLLRDADIASEKPADIITAMWHKWVFVSTVGALTCLMRGTVADINAVPGGTGLGPAVLAEAAAVAAAAGHPVPDEELASTTNTVTRPGVPLSSSLYRDVVAGQSTEAEHILGDLVSRARAYGIPTPLMDLAALQLRVHQHRLNG